jgi:hypothetical protein
MSPLRSGGRNTSGASPGRGKSINDNNTTKLEVAITREDRENLRHKIYEKIYKG